MTTDIRISTNGSYVSEGSITIERGEGQGGSTAEEFKVGPGYPFKVERAFNVPHGSSVTLVIKERSATVEELAEASAKAAGAANAG